MGKKVAPLTVAAVRAAPVGKRLFDGNGLVLSTDVLRIQRHVQHHFRR
jgi:hypothetical protein